MSRPLWFVSLLKKSFPQRFRLARMTHLPVIGRLTDQSLFAGDDLVYLPSDRSILINQDIDLPDEFVMPSRVVDHFIDNASHHWIMDFCICRESNLCSDYPRQYGCIFLGEAVHKINPRLGRLVTKEEAHRHADRCREAGLVHVIGLNKLDVMWLGAGPGEKLLTICNCCPCCCLWKVLPEITPRIGLKVKRMPGVEVSVSERCLGCGICTEGICFVDAIHLVDGHAYISADCRGCGRCVEVCPNAAIDLHFTSIESVDQTIKRLSQQVDLR